MYNLHIHWRSCLNYFEIHINTQLSISQYLPQIICERNEFLKTEAINSVAHSVESWDRDRDI